MSDNRGNRKTRVGVVVSDKMDKTIVVEMKTKVTHPCIRRPSTRPRS